jgi:large subunit ribosomal protein L6
MHGTWRAIIANMAKGVSEGWSKQLELVGTGYRAEGSERDLTLTVGYSHPVEIKAPEGISFSIEKTLITVEGIDKELVGQVAAKIRNVRPPEPYKGKGIKYIDEVVRRKPGKAAKAQGAVA